jgi:hypothetical protein
MKQYAILAIYFLGSTAASGATLELEPVDRFSTTIYRMHIDETSSVVSHVQKQWAVDQATGSLVLVSDTVDFSISGVVNVIINYYEHDCIGSSCAYSESIISFSQPQVVVDAKTYPEFIFPTFPAYFNNPPNFDTDSHPCTVTLYGTLCTGWSFGSPSRYSGVFDGVTLEITGINPLDSVSDTYYDYNITATLVPVPASFWLIGSGLLGLFGIANRKLS